MYNQVSRTKKGASSHKSNASLNPHKRERRVGLKTEHRKSIDGKDNHKKMRRDKKDKTNDSVHSTIIKLKRFYSDTTYS